MNLHRVLCLVDKYFPESSANTVCAENVMNYFKSQGVKVDILAIKECDKNDSYSFQNGSNVFKFDTRYNKLLKHYKEKHNAKKWTDIPLFIRKPYSMLCIISRFWECSTENISLDRVNYKKIYKHITSITKGEKYDAIISFSYPFAFQVLAKKLVKMGIAEKWYPFFLDPFVFNSTLKTSKTGKRKKVAQKYLSSADKIFMVYGIKDENIRQGYNPEYHKKIVEVAMPNLVDRTTLVKPNNSNIVLSYAGLFYDKIRNPKKMLEILSNLSNNFAVNLMGQGCEKIVKEKQKLFNSCQLNIWGQVQHSKCIEILLNSDILINLGNTITNQTPSKVLEYIGMGKPIINFYFKEEDTSLIYLKRYPLCFNINVNNYTRVDIENMIEFCKNNKGKTISFEEATINLKNDTALAAVESVYKEIL